jgi:hypothetical protein
MKRVTKDLTKHSVFVNSPEESPELREGDELWFEGQQYTLKNGSLIDEKGNSHTIPTSRVAPSHWVGFLPLETNVTKIVRNGKTLFNRTNSRRS